MADVRYSKKLVNYTIIDEAKGESRKYAANKLGVKDASIEFFKLGRALVPGFGVMLDAAAMGEESAFSINDRKFGEIMFFIAENLTEEHFAELESKLMGSVYFDGKPLGDEWEDHFDEYTQDFIEILGWLGKENFESLFIKSTIVARLKTNFKIPGVMTLVEKLGFEQKEPSQDK